MRACRLQWRGCSGRRRLIREAGGERKVLMIYRLKREALQGDEGHNDGALVMDTLAVLPWYR